MSVQAWRELPRTFEREVGKEPETLTRRFVVTLGDNTLTGSGPPGVDAIATAIGLPTMGNISHPDLSLYKNRKVRMEEGFEGNPYEVLVTVEYGIVLDSELLAPESRPAEWGVESSTIEVPALFYYHGSGNNDKRPLTNSANDYFQGLTMQEPIIRLRYRKNFVATSLLSGGFPWSQVNSVNHVNNASWGNAAIHTCRVESATVAYEEVAYNSLLKRLWVLDATIAYRQSTWNMQLPDVGWNFLESGQKRRAMVFDFNNSEWVASPNPVGLNGSGSLTLGTPAVLNRRPCPEATFSTLFGNPPS